MEMFWIFSGFLGGSYLEDSFWRMFLGRSFLGLMFLSRFCLNKEGGGGRTRNLDP